MGPYIFVETCQVLGYPEMHTAILATILLGLAPCFVMYSLEFRICRYWDQKL